MNQLELILAKIGAMGSAQVIPFSYDMGRPIPTYVHAHPLKVERRF
jgi:hypothetical protein